MSNDSIPVTVRILDKEYRVACSREEEQSLVSSARFLDQKMREIRAGGKVLGTDRIAVMAALNLAHELLEGESEKTDKADSINRRLRSMQQKIEVALNQGNQLEL
jgi:cell division protein ZapA